MKYPAKYPALNLGDAHFANFWSLAIFRGSQIIQPRTEISGPNIWPHFCTKTMLNYPGVVN
jgi:hypothetical protein